MEIPTCLESIATSLSILKDEQLPALQSAITQRLDKMNGNVARAMTDIEDLKQFRTIHETKLTTMKWVGTIIFGALTFFISIVALIR